LEPESVGVIGGGKWSVGDITVALVQTLVRNNLSDIVKEFSLVVVDECFPSGTKVSGRNIEDIRIGDYTISFDENSRSLCTRKVVKLFKKRPTALVKIRFNGYNLVCTPSHPVYTKDGWKRADSLTTEDSVYCTRKDNEYEKNDRQTNTMQRMWERGDPLYSRREEEDLRQIYLLLRRMQDCLHRKNALANNVSNKQTIYFCQNDSKKPNAECYNAREGFPNSEGYWTHNSLQRGEWKTSPDSTRNHVPCLAEQNVFYMANGTPYTNEDAEELWVPNLLQGGHGLLGTKSCLRDRRLESLCHRQAGAGCEERELLGWAGVDNVEILEQTSDGTFGGLCPDGFVYTYLHSQRSSCPQLPSYPREHFL
jgi:hypothetical protein